MSREEEYQKLLNKKREQSLNLQEETYYLLGSVNTGVFDDDSDDEDTKSPGSSTKAYYVGCLFSLAAALINASNFVTSQLLDDVVDVYQLSFGLFIVMFILVVCYMLYNKKGPQCVERGSSGWMTLFIVAEFMFVPLTYMAAVHIALGTLNALLVLSFVVATFFISLMKAAQDRTLCEMTAFAINLATVALISIAVIFLVQPTELFSGIDYFHSVNDSYRSLCNSHRFELPTNLSSPGNITASTLTDAYKSASWEGYIYAILAGLCNTAEVVSGKKLLKHHALQDILFWMSLVCCGICLAIVLFTGGFSFPDNPLCTGFLVLNAFSGGLYDCFYFIGMCYISSLDVAVISGCVLPLLFIFQFTFLRTISPTPTNTVAIIAAVLVLVTVVGKPMLQGLLFHKGYIKLTK